MNPGVFIAVTLSWAWSQPAPSVDVYAGGYANHVESGSEVYVSPATLHWSPDDGFWLSSDVGAQGVAPLR